MLKAYNNNDCIDVHKKPLVGEIWWAKIPNAIGHQQGGTHPVFVYSNNVFNKFSEIVDVFPLTSQVQKNSPVHVYITKKDVANLPKDSMIQIENTWHINQYQLLNKIGTLSLVKQREVAEKMTVQFSILNLLQLVQS